MYQPEIDPDPAMTRGLIHERELNGSPLRVIDGGARLGAEPHWATYGDHVELIAFEPDPEECQRLSKAAGLKTDGPVFTCVPMALGSHREQAQLQIARYPDSSSMLKNNHGFVNRFAMREYLSQVDTTTVEVTDVDSYLGEHALTYLDFMKLDVEGAELDVLLGAEQALRDSVLGLSVEVWFHHDHRDRPLFADIDAHLRHRGFALFDLRQLNRWRRTTLAGKSYDSWVGSGQLMYGNAVYFRDLPAQVEAEAGPQLSGIAVKKLASLAEVYCYPDFALEVLESSGRAGLLPVGQGSELAALLRRRAPASTQGWRTPVRRAARAAIPPRARRRLMRFIQGLISE